MRWDRESRFRQVENFLLDLALLILLLTGLWKVVRPEVNEVIKAFTSTPPAAEQSKEEPSKAVLP